MLHDGQQVDFDTLFFSRLLVTPPDRPGAAAIDVHDLPRVLVAECWNKRDLPIRLLVRRFVALTTVATCHVFFDHRAQAFPVEYLADRIDRPVDSGVLQIAVIPFNDALLHRSWYPDFAVDRQYVAAFNFDCRDSRR
jgi:hypothetical protein